jgi:cytochrome c biogenesis protein CcmG/thiol:disulfide interchange protein DsbE
MTTGTDIEAGMTSVAVPDPSHVARGRGMMRRPSRGWLIVAAVVPLLLLGAWGGLLAIGSAPPAGARLGEPAPQFDLADLDGNPLRLSDLRGRPVLVNFWASWCAPCVEEFPLLRDAHDRYAGEGLVVVGIVFRDGSEAARAFMARMGARWQAAIDPGEETARRYGIYAPPETFFIDRDGVVAGRQIGQLSAADLERGLTTIMGEE